MKESIQVAASITPRFETDGREWTYCKRELAYLRPEYSQVTFGDKSYWHRLSNINLDSCLGFYELADNSQFRMLSDIYKELKP